MSDPAKSEQIEDVLSSIRRLVADHQPVPEGTSPIPMPSDNPDDGGKLILTAALRVTDPDDPWRPIEANDGADDPAETVEAAEDVAALPDMPDGEDGPEIGVAADPPQDGFESEIGDSDWPDESSGTVALNMAALRFARHRAEDQAAPHEPALPDDAGLQAAAPDDADDAAAAAPEDGEEDSGLTETDSALIWEDSAPADDATDDGTTAEAAEATTEVAETPFQTGSAALTAEEDHTGEDVTDDPAPDHDPWVEDLGADLAEDAEAAPETDEAEMEVTADWADADQAAEDAPPVFSRSPASSDRVVSLGAQLDHAEGDDALEDDVEDLGEEPGLFTFPDSGEDSVIDEEILRELIADVVREELQGLLGQRLTRNVRKMVRREIRMAMAAEGLE